MQHCSRRHVSPRYTIKTDIQKAYDSIHWGFIEDMMLALCFPHQFVYWVMKCVTSVSYSISYNGALHGYFQGRKGLRQGDPMSPFLFVLGMEYVSCLLKWHIQQGQFEFHLRCQRLSISHLCFADDAMFFCNWLRTVVRWLKHCLDRFAPASGLFLNVSKSVVFLGGMPASLKSEICQELG